MNDEEMVKVGEKLANSECDGMMMSIHPNKGNFPLSVLVLTSCTGTFCLNLSLQHAHSLMNKIFTILYKSL